MSQLEDRLLDSSMGRAALDHWSRINALPRAVKIRYGAYAVGGLIVLVGGIWRLSTLGGATPMDATLKKAEQIRQQAAVEPPPPVESSNETYTGPEPKSVKGGGMPPR